MATTSLWRIKGQMGHVIDYVENADKTTSPMEIPNELASDTLEDLIAYAGREEATNKRKLITGINLDYHDARSQMMIVKRKFEKEKGTIAYHGYQSFAEGEVDPDTAHKIGVALANELWGDRFQVVVCTHLDKASHIHNHFVINTVSHTDGRKFFRSESDYRKMREVSDRLCREYGLSVIRDESRLLKDDILRNDEISFMLKTKEGSTIIKSLEKYQLRSDKKIYEALFDGTLEAIPQFNEALLGQIVETNLNKREQ